MPDYLITIQPKAPAADEKLVTTERLVRAKNQSQALGHVVSDSVFVKIADTEDIIRLAQAGVRLESTE